MTVLTLKNLRKLFRPPWLFRVVLPVAVCFVLLAGAGLFVALQLLSEPAQSSELAGETGSESEALPQLPAVDGAVSGSSSEAGSGEATGEAGAAEAGAGSGGAGTGVGAGEAGAAETGGAVAGGASAAETGASGAGAGATYPTAAESDASSGPDAARRSDAATEPGNGAAANNAVKPEDNSSSSNSGQAKDATPDNTAQPDDAATQSNAKPGNVAAAGDGTAQDAKTVNPPAKEGTGLGTAEVGAVEAEEDSPDALTKSSTSPPESTELPPSKLPIFITIIAIVFLLPAILGLVLLTGFYNRKPKAEPAPKVKYHDFN